MQKRLSVSIESVVSIFNYLKITLMKNRLTMALLAGACLVLSLASCTDEASSASSLSLTQESVSISVSETVSLQVEIDPATFRSEGLYWYSENPEIAAVNKKGEVTGISAGTTSIHVEGYGCSSSCLVNVSIGSVEMMSFGETYFNVRKGESFMLPLKVFPDGIPMSNVEWTCSDEAVVSLSQGGEVTALEEGYATVTATCGDMSATCTVYVYGDPEIGNFFYSDDSWSDELLSGKQLVGIVFWTGDPTADDITLRTRFPECKHGLVVSLNDSRAMWQESYEVYDGLVDAWKREDSKMKYMMDISYFYGEGKESEKISGFNNTVVLKAFNDDIEHYFDKVGIVEGLEEQTHNYPLPESVSGWYVPSVKELSLLCSGEVSGVWGVSTPQTEIRDVVNEFLAQVEGADVIAPVIYWSSNEMYEETSIILDMVGGYVNQCSKNIELNVRYVFAF